MKPLERSPTPRSRSNGRKRMKKRKERNRPIKTYRQLDNYEDFHHHHNEKHFDDSSNDEGFASGRPSSVSDSVSTYNTVLGFYSPTLTTMLEDTEIDELELDAHFINHLDLYETEVESYLESEALKNGRVLQQVEQSWKIFLQPAVSVKYIQYLIAFLELDAMSPSTLTYKISLSLLFTELLNEDLFRNFHREK